MTLEQQRIAIAEACGWLITDNGSNGHRVEGSRNGWQRGFKPEPLPNYLHDLNAMHEAEKVLTEKQLAEYWRYLVEMHGGDIQEPGVGQEVNSTAPQRAEAFLRTLNLWEDDKP